MKTINQGRKGGARNAAAPDMPKPLAGMGPLAQKLDAAFREVVARQVTVRDVEVTQPRDYTPAAVRSVRESMRVSQGVFALLVGVSPETVENWEQGIIAPRPIARRLLDVIAADPAGYRAMLLKQS